MSYRIVVADKDPQSREAVAQSLAADNIFVGVSSSSELKKQIKAEKPDLIILNTVLQDSPGWHAVHQVVKGIKSSRDYGDIPVILVTGDPGGPSSAEAREAGADGYLSKPIDGSHLKQAVQSLLGLSTTTTVHDENEEILIDFADDDSGDMTEELLAMSNIALNGEEPSTEVGDTVEIDTGTLVAELDHGDMMGAETYEDTVRLNLEDMGLDDDLDESTAFEPTIELVADVPTDFGPAPRPPIEAEEQSVEIDLAPDEQELDFELESEAADMDFELESLGEDVDEEVAAESVEIDLEAAERSVEIDLASDSETADLELGDEMVEHLELEDLHEEAPLPDFSSTREMKVPEAARRDSVTVEMDVSEIDLELDSDLEEEFSEGRADTGTIDLDDTAIGEILEVQEPSSVLTSKDLELDDDSLGADAAADLPLDGDIIDLEDDTEIRSVEFEQLEEIQPEDSGRRAFDLDETEPIEKDEMEQMAQDDLGSIDLDETEETSLDLETPLDITGPYEEEDYGELSLDEVEEEEMTTQEFFGEELPTEEFPTEKFPDEKTRDIKEQPEITLDDVDLGEMKTEPPPATGEIPLEEITLEAEGPPEEVFGDYEEEEPVLEVTEDISLEEITLEEKGEEFPEVPIQPRAVEPSAPIVGTEASAEPQPTVAETKHEPHVAPPPTVSELPPAHGVQAALTEVLGKADIKSLIASAIGEHLGGLGLQKPDFALPVQASLQEAVPSKDELADAFASAVQAVMPSREELLDRLLATMSGSLPSQEQLIARVDEMIKSSLPSGDSMVQRVEDVISKALPTPEEIVEKVDASLKKVVSEEEINRRLEEAFKGMPTPDTIQLRIDEALRALPQKDELDRRIDETFVNFPTPEAILARVDEALKAIPSQEEITKRFDEAVKALPSTQAVMDRIDEALRVIPSREEIDRRFDEAIAAIPTADLIRDRVDQVLSAIPTREEVRERIDSAIGAWPASEEIAERLDAALTGLPSSEDLSQRLDAAVAAVPETVSRVIARLEEFIATLPTKETIEKDMESVRKALPTSQEILERVDAALIGIPSAEEISSRIERAFSGLPTGEVVSQQLDRVLANVVSEDAIREQIQSSLARAISPELLIERLDNALRVMPSQEYIRLRLDSAFAAFPSPDAMNTRLDLALQRFPSQEAIDAKVDQAIALIPTGKAIEERVDQALQSMPSRETVMQKIDEFLSALPSPDAVNARIDEHLERLMPTREEVSTTVGRLLQERINSVISEEDINRALAALLPETERILASLQAALPEKDRLRETIAAGITQAVQNTLPEKTWLESVSRGLFDEKTKGLLPTRDEVSVLLRQEIRGKLLDVVEKIVREQIEQITQDLSS